MPPRQPPAAGSALPELSASVGRRVRELRERHGTSLSALAVATGLGKGTLSELERGRRNPTLDTLFTIATALSVPLGDLLVAHDDDHADGRSAGPHARGQSLDAQLIGRWSEASEAVEVYRMTVDRGRRESSPHATGVTETITVIDGDVAVGNDDAPARLRGGQSHTFAGDRAHLFVGLAARSSTVLIMRYPLAASSHARPGHGPDTDFAP